MGDFLWGEIEGRSDIPYSDAPEKCREAREGYFRKSVTVHARYEVLGLRTNEKTPAPVGELG
jgi:hypothetical protein